MPERLIGWRASHQICCSAGGAKPKGAVHQAWAGGTIAAPPTCRCLLFPSGAETRRSPRACRRA
uniref:Predicted protein n=1 Tax=Hordeum vulgare subsp. vulgare TaxID=112509 RepID=F2E421_HORVV|nr:predicted protein [Hordeum vulgare subsp. vulgare]